MRQNFHTSFRQAQLLTIEAHTTFSNLQEEDNHHHHPAVPDHINFYHWTVGKDEKIIRLKYTATSFIADLSLAISSSWSSFDVLRAKSFSSP